MARSRRRAGRNPAVLQRKLHVLERRRRESRLKPWKMNPMSRLRTMARPIVGSPADVEPAEAVAAARGPVEAAEDVHHRRLSRAARAHDGDELAGRDRNGHVTERAHEPRLGAVFFGDAGKLDERLAGRRREQTVVRKLLLH